MRLLFLSNFYPPARPGGYTQWCSEVADRLARRGHTIGVLTSRHERLKAPANEPYIYRWLHLEGDLNYYQPLRFFTTWSRQHRENLALFKDAIRQFEPDLIFVWGMWALTKALPALAEQLLPGRVVYYLSDYWPSATDMHTAYWQSPANHWLMRPVRRWLGRLALAKLARAGQPALQFEHAMCVSARVRALLVEAGVPVQPARVVHGGTDVERFLPIPEQNFDMTPLKLLYAGQLVRHKGIHTALEALAQLVHERGLTQLSLTLVGSGHPQYEAELRDFVARRRLDGYVTFHPAVTRDQMPTLMQQHAVLVFPSIYEEPLARMTQEAMASGLVVVGTTTGGTSEILRDGENGLTFAPEDAAGLAGNLARLFADRRLCRRLAQAGRQTVLEHFTLDRMVSEIETYLSECLARPPLPVPHAV